MSNNCELRGFFFKTQLPYSPVFSRVSAHGHLQFTAQKTGMGAYTEKSFVCMMDIHVCTNYRIITNGSGCLHGDGRLLGRIRTVLRSQCVFLAYAPMCKPYADTIIENAMHVKKIGTLSFSYVIETGRMVYCCVMDPFPVGVKSEH